MKRAIEQEAVDEVRGSVPVGEVLRVLSALHDAVPELDGPAGADRLPPHREENQDGGSDEGGGLLWLATDASGDAGAAAIRDAVRAAGGHATLLRAPPEVRAAVDVFEPQAEAVMRVTAGIKAALDPAGVLNPGRMYAGV